MRQLRWLFLAASTVLLAAPSISIAQQKEDPEDFKHDVLNAIFGPNWNVFAHGGLTTNGRFMLQSPPAPALGERSLDGASGFDFGLGAGVDILLHSGFRLGYTYASNDLEFRTDNGDGSTALDVDNIGTLKTHTASVEVMRYMLPARAAFTPYGTVGLVGTWWVLDQNSALIVPAGGSTQFRWGGVATVGFQGRLSEQLNLRLEYVKASTGSPFNGEHSFRIATGSTIDKPTRASKTDYRLAVVYYLSRPEEPPKPQTRAATRGGKRTRNP
jgi:hypothetical protein